MLAMERGVRPPQWGGAGLFLVGYIANLDVLDGRSRSIFDQNFPTPQFRHVPGIATGPVKRSRPVGKL